MKKDRTGIEGIILENCLEGSLNRKKQCVVSPTLAAQENKSETGRRRSFSVRNHTLSLLLEDEMLTSPAAKTPCTVSCPCQTHDLGNNLDP